MGDRAFMALLRYWSMSDQTFELGIHEHPEVLEVEQELQKSFLKELIREKRLNEN